MRATIGTLVMVGCMAIATSGAAAEYHLEQLTDVDNPDDHYNPHSDSTSVSDDGQRIVFAHRTDTVLNRIPSIWLYDASWSEPLRLSARVDGSVRTLCAYHPQISGDGTKIVFASRGFYTSARDSGIYLYDVATGEVRLIAADSMPRDEEGNPLNGQPGWHKYEGNRPSISYDGKRISFILTDYEHGATRDGWSAVRDRLILLDLTESTIRGTGLVAVWKDGAFGGGISSQRIAANGQTVAFYAGGEPRGLQVSNLEMTFTGPRETSEHAGPTHEVYCYVVVVQSPGHYRLSVVPDPESPADPLLVAFPEEGSVQAFHTPTVLGNPPSPNRDGSLVALNAGFRMGAANTGIYLYDPMGDRTAAFITLGEEAGAGPGDRTLVTGAAPSLSPSGRWLGYYRRGIEYPEGYGHPELMEPGEHYCPKVVREEILVVDLGTHEESLLTEEGTIAEYGWHTNMSVALAREARTVAFVSTGDLVGLNMDTSHEVFLGSLMSAKSGRQLPPPDEKKLNILSPMAILKPASSPLPQN